jgi:hypothetical protein
MNNLPSDHLLRLQNQNETMRGLLLWILYHHQGGKSAIGQPIRKVLGIGEHAALTPREIKEAKIAAGMTSPIKGEKL